MTNRTKKERMNLNRLGKKTRPAADRRVSPLQTISRNQQIHDPKSDHAPLIIGVESGRAFPGVYVVVVLVVLEVLSFRRHPMSSHFIPKHGGYQNLRRPLSPDCELTDTFIGSWLSLA